METLMHYGIAEIEIIKILKTFFGIDFTVDLERQYKKSKMKVILSHFLQYKLNSYNVPQSPC